MGVCEHMDSWLDAQIFAILELNKNAQTKFYLSHILRFVIIENCNNWVLFSVLCQADRDLQAQHEFFGIKLVKNVFGVFKPHSSDNHPYGLWLRG